MTLDIIIVGQGIAGSCLAITALNKGLSVLVVDTASQTTATQLSAGMYTPITGKRFSLSWLVSETYPFSLAFYKDLEKTFSTKLIYDNPTNRFFSTQDERLRYEKRKDDPSFEPYLGTFIDEDKFSQFHCPYGGVVLNQSGYIDMSIFLKETNSFLKSKESLYEGSFNSADFSIQKNGVTCGDYSAKRIIFCEGYKVSKNPFFSQLPYQHAKSEVLTIMSKDISCDHVVNKGLWLKPMGDHHYLCGTTHDWENLNDSPTAQAKTSLIKQLNTFLRVPYKIVDHKAAVKPIIKDRKPLVGLHPEYNQIGILNGLGSKGAMLAPYFSEKLCLSLCDHEALEKDVRCDRFYK